MAPDCIFCKIAAGDIPSKRVYEDDEVVAFKDLNPVAPTHFLVIPRRHIAGLSAVGPEDAPVLGKVQAAVAKIAAENGLEDFRVIANNGRGAGQSVDHLHYHLLGGRIMKWPPG